jgi:hypothetical protein
MGTRAVCILFLLISHKFNACFLVTVATEELSPVGGTLPDKEWLSPLLHPGLMYDNGKNFLKTFCVYSWPSFFHFLYAVCRLTCETGYV